MSGSGDIQWRLKAMIADMLQERQAHADRIALIDVELADAKVALDAIAQMATPAAAPLPVVAAVVTVPKKEKKLSLLTADAVRAFLLQAGPQDTESILLHFGVVRKRGAGATLAFHERRGAIAHVNGLWCLPEVAPA